MALYFGMECCPRTFLRAFNCYDIKFEIDRSVVPDVEPEECIPCLIVWCIDCNLYLSYLWCCKIVLVSLNLFKVLRCILGEFNFNSISPVHT